MYMGSKLERKYMSNKSHQIIYLAVDDSGQLSKSDNIMTFGGIILFENEINDFKINYEKIVMSLKNKYKRYNELKHSNLKSKHLNLFCNYLNNFLSFGVIINNKAIYNNIMNNSKAKGRYLDYAIKLMLKNVIDCLIKDKLINPYINLILNIYVDQTSYLSNGYYNLKDSIYEELRYGMSNIKNNINFKNIIYSKLTINLSYRDSKKDYLIQASDLIAGEIRKNYIKNTNLTFVNYLIYLPKKC